MIIHWGFKMKWQDYKEQRYKAFGVFPSGNWQLTNIECPYCGELIYKNITALTSNPPRYQYKCTNCDWCDYWY